MWRGNIFTKVLNVLSYSLYVILRRKEISSFQDRYICNITFSLQCLPNQLVLSNFYVIMITEKIKKSYQNMKNI